MIYFDSAATTLQKPPAVPRAVAWAIRQCSSPGRGDSPSLPPGRTGHVYLPEELSELFEARDRNGWCLPSMPPTP